MLVFQINSVGVELFSCVNTFFCSNKCAQIMTYVNDLWLHGISADNSFDHEAIKRQVISP